jgi:arabinogalactan oligomer/maltooligosaccharide transport system permease protein
MSRMRFNMRKPLMNMGIILGLFPGVLSMIAIYFILKSLGLTDSLLALIIVYSASSGLGYLVAKGFFDTIPKSLDEAARIDGARQIDVFRFVILPLSKPIIVYTALVSFLAPWMDFVFARIIMTSRDTNKYTVAIGLFNMLDRNLINSYFAIFCAAAVIVSIPISLLFIIMQRFYVEGVTGGSVKG